MRFVDPEDGKDPDNNISAGRPGLTDLLDIFFDLIKLNILFLLASIPIITLPAAISAVTWVVSRIVRKKDYSVWKDFWKGFRSDFGLSLILGLLITVVYYLIGVAILYYANVMRSSWLGLLLIVPIASLLAIPVMMSLYSFTLTATVELPLFGVIKNAFVLTFLNFRNNLIMLLIFVAVVALVLKYYPLSLGVFIMPVLPLLRLVEVSLQFPSIEKYVAAKI